MFYDYKKAWWRLSDEPKRVAVRINKEILLRVTGLSYVIVFYTPTVTNYIKVKNKDSFMVVGRKQEYFLKYNGITGCFVPSFFLFFSPPPVAETNKT